MNNKKFLKIVFGLCFFISFAIVSINYIVNPYGVYRTIDFFPNKPEQDKNIRLVKATKISKIKPVSIVLGTSRTEFGYDPNHKYFIKPSYNLGLSAASLYEIKKYLEHTIAQGNLKKVLLVVDWISFNNEKMIKSEDFESYFEEDNIYKQLFSIDLFKSSLNTIRKQKTKNSYLENGQKDFYLNQEKINKGGGHLQVMKEKEKVYYTKERYKYNSNIYQDTRKYSFDDFKNILELCYKNDIVLDIVMGPSHVRQWEAFDYYQNIETWYEWKKDIVLFVEKIAKDNNKGPFRIMDFSVYHEFTTEIIPTNSKEKMKYYWESSHYKNELGRVVLDRLADISDNKDFGIELNSQNINEHIQNLRNSRNKFIDTKAYREEVFNDSLILKK